MTWWFCASRAMDFRAPEPGSPSSQDPSKGTGAGSGSASYGQILRSSVLVGAASGFVILIGMVRTKIVAVLLRTSGFGLMGSYTSILDLCVSLAAMGIGESGVRQIAEAV